MRRSVTETKTTLAADEILQCRCRAGESWPADCSRAVVQRLLQMSFDSCKNYITTARDILRVRPCLRHWSHRLKLTNKLLADA